MDLYDGGVQTDCIMAGNADGPICNKQQNQFTIAIGTKSVFHFAVVVVVSIKK
jgi:hypothetical protein